MESGVRETLASILSLSSFTRPVKAVHQTHSFTGSVYVVRPVLSFKSLSNVQTLGLFYLYDGGENKYK